jgi:hypothetical protein
MRAPTPPHEAAPTRHSTWFGAKTSPRISRTRLELLAGFYRVLKPRGLFTSTEYSVGPGGDILFPVPWAYDASINLLESADVMRAQYHTAGFRILE